MENIQTQLRAALNAKKPLNKQNLLAILGTIEADQLPSLYVWLFALINDQLLEDACKNQPNEIFANHRTFSISVHDIFLEKFPSTSNLIKQFGQVFRALSQQQAMSQNELSQWKRAQSDTGVKKENIILHCLFNNSPNLLLNKDPSIVLKDLFDVALHNSVVSLADRDLRLSFQVLLSLGLAPLDIIQRIFMTTVHESLRSFCYQQLVECPGFYESVTTQSETFQYLKSLRKIYTDESVAELTRNLTPSFKYWSQLFNKVAIDNNFKCQDIGPVLKSQGQNENSKKIPAYMQLAYDWLEKILKGENGDARAWLLKTEGRHLTGEQPLFVENDPDLKNFIETAWFYGAAYQSISLLKQMNSIERLENFQAIWSQLAPSLQWPFVRLTHWIPSDNENESFYWKSIIQDSTDESLLIEKSQSLKICPAYVYFSLNDNYEMIENEESSKDPWCRWLLSAPCDYALENSFDLIGNVDPLVHLVRQNLCNRSDDVDSNVLLKYPALRLLSKTSKINPFDVSIYQFIDRFTKLDVAKCFTWQDGNSIATRESLSSFHDRFSSSTHNKEHSNQHRRAIDYRYLVGQHRPLTALAHFLASTNNDHQEKLQRSTSKSNSAILTDQCPRRLKNFLISSCKENLKNYLSTVVLFDMCNEDTFNTRLYVSMMKFLKSSSIEEKSAISLRLLPSTYELKTINVLKQLIVFNLFSELNSLSHIPTLLTSLHNRSAWFEMLFISQIFHYSIDDIMSCLSQTQSSNMVFEHFKCCFKEMVKQNHTPLFKQDIFALLTDHTLTTDQLKKRVKEGAQQCSRPLLAVLYNTLQNVSSIDSFLLFLQSLNPTYPHLFPKTSNSSSVASHLLCHIAELGHWTVLLLATHIFAQGSRLESLIYFCQKCIDMDEQTIPKFLTSSQTPVGLSQSEIWFSQLTHELLICVFRQVSSHGDIRAIFNLLGAQNEFYKRFETLFSLLEDKPSPVAFDWSLLMYKDRCYRSVMPLIENLIKSDRFDLVDEIVDCVDIEIDVILFERFKCSFDDYNHTADIDDKELDYAFETMCQEHSEILKRLKKPSMYSDFLLSIRVNSSKLVSLMLLIFSNHAQSLPEPYEYSPIQAKQEPKRTLTERLLNNLVDFTHEFQSKPIISKVFDYMVTLFSLSMLDQLAQKQIIPADFDDYLRIYEELEIEEVEKEEEPFTSFVPKDPFEAALLRNVTIVNKNPNPAEQMTRSLSIGSNRNATSRASSSSHIATFAPPWSRHSSASFVGSINYDLHNLTDKELRKAINIIQDAFLQRLSPILSFQFATKFRMASFNLVVFSYAYRLYSNILSPADVRARIDQLPQADPCNQSNKKRLTNLLRARSITVTSDEQITNIDDQKQRLLERLVSRTSHDDRFITLIYNLFKISRLFRLDSSRLLIENGRNDEWILFNRLISYPSSSFPAKIKLAEQFSKQIKLDQQLLVEFIVDQTDKTLERAQKNDMSDDYHCWPFDPNNILSYKQFIAIINEKCYEAIGKQLVDRSQVYENRFLSMTPRDPSSKLIHLRVELLIYAHICFINACHMEGICLVLNHARHICLILESSSNYHLLIRLLIGLQQYSEMIYVFDILFESEQFELLLSIATTKNDEYLNAALFDYIKRHHPNNEHAFTSVSMNLNMHQEVAVMHRDAGDKLMKSLENQQSMLSSESSVTLQSLVRYYSDAADTFYLAGCCLQSEKCLKKARLVSLQLEFLQRNSPMIVLNLKPKNIHELLPKFESCWYAFIVADAYDEYSVWPACLIQQFICNKEPSANLYWEEFQQLISIDDQFILNTVKSLTKRHFSMIVPKNFEELLSQITDCTIIALLQQVFTANDASLSSFYTIKESMYLLDRMQLV